MNDGESGTGSAQLGTWRCENHNEMVYEIGASYGLPLCDNYILDD